MDEPNVSWKMYDKLVEERGENEQLPGLINVGSCGIHVVHGAFRSGAQKTKLGFDSILKALYKLFDESPAKREDYSAVNGSNRFPLLLCGNRWVEDKKVVEGALQIWPDVMVYIKETIKMSKGEVPVSYSFTTIRHAVQDCLITAKLEFFLSTASTMEPFLLMLQADAPLLPFIVSELKTLLETLMGKFVMKKELDVANTTYKIDNVGVLSIDHQIMASQVDVGFAAPATLAKRLKEKKISESQMIEFRRECCTMCATIVAKIQERSPLKHLLARKLASLDPRVMVLHPTKAAQIFQKVLKSLIELKCKTSEQADRVLAQKVCF